MLNSIRRGGFALLVAVVFFATTGLASATTFNFTRSSSQNPLGLSTGNLGHSVSVSKNGLALQIAAYDAPGDPGSLHRSQQGLGVVGGAANNTVGAPESIKFIFSGQIVAVRGVIYERGTDSGSLDLYVDGVFADRIHWEEGGGTRVRHDFGDHEGSTIELRGNRKSFRVSKLTVNRIGTPVPEPSAALLFGLGVVVASNAVRRRDA